MGTKHTVAIEASQRRPTHTIGESEQQVSEARRAFASNAISASLAGAFAMLVGSAAAHARSASRAGIDHGATRHGGRHPGVLNANAVAPSPELGLLNRISFGPTAQSLADVQQMGISAYIDWQLDMPPSADDEVNAFIAATYPSVDKPASFFRNFPQVNQEAVQDRIRRELKAATLYRSINAQRQLYEVMVEFWSNHFSIFHSDAPVSKSVDDFEVIRPNAFGLFHQILRASAQSPAMLSYLDNFVNTVDGINENYARELMELHTIGVNGGYDNEPTGFTEEDVKAAAYCLTGWTIDFTPENFGEFLFDPNLHSVEPRQFLGKLIPGGGQAMGFEVLRILAQDRAVDTAKQLATKLCRRFIDDDPSQGIVDQVASAYGTDGDIKAMLRELLHSTEFMDVLESDSKVKRPYTYVASMLRASDAVVTIDSNIDGVAELGELVGRLGHSPFAWAPPNGYPDVAGYWINTNSMLTRWSEAIALAEANVPGVTIDLPGLCDDANTANSIVDNMAANLVYRTLDTRDRDALVMYAQGTAPSPDTPLTEPSLLRAREGVFALLCGSTYFQTR